MRNIYEKVSCPVCGSKDGVRFRTKGDLVDCMGCGVIYLRSRLTPKSMEQFYQTYADDHSHMRIPTTVDELLNAGLRREAFVKKLVELKPPPGSVLDIGSGWGALLLNCRSKGYEVTGVELTKKAVTFSKNILGINVWPLQVEEMPLEEKYSAVVLYHTLEHLPYTAKALTAIHQLLLKGGVICGVVPNIASLCSTSLGDQWQWLDPDVHYTHFKPETMRSTLEKFGFKVLEITTTSGDYPVNMIEPCLSRGMMTLDEVNKRLMGEEIHFWAVK